MKFFKNQRQIIESPSYFPNRMEKMMRECFFYLEQMENAKNSLLRKSYAKMAVIYFNRCKYYFKKQTEHELR